MCAALLGCGGASAREGSTLIPPFVHESEIAFGVPVGAPLRTLPFAQTYAWVAPSQLWLGTLPRDDLMGDRRFVVGLKAKTEISFRALDWREVAPADARYHVSILLAERTLSGSAPARPGGQRVSRGNEEPQYGAPYRQTASRVYRGIALRRLSDGAVFWHLLWTGDQWNNETILANLMAELAVGRAPIPEDQ
jgi:hypothetical protein